jgi:hypothetical protein
MGFVWSSSPARKPDYWCLAVPTVTTVFAGWFAITATAAPFGPVPYYFLPFWFGLLSAPGYLLAWNALRQFRILPGPQQAFAVASVWASILCSLAGAVFSGFTIVGGVLSLWSAVLAFMLLRKLRALPSASAEAG